MSNLILCKYSRVVFYFIYFYSCTTLRALCNMLRYATSMALPANK